MIKLSSPAVTLTERKNSNISFFYFFRSLKKVSVPKKLNQKDIIQSKIWILNTSSIFLYLVERNWKIVVKKIPWWFDETISHLAVLIWINELLLISDITRDFYFGEGTVGYIGFFLEIM